MSADVVIAIITVAFIYWWLFKVGVPQEFFREFKMIYWDSLIQRRLQTSESMIMAAVMDAPKDERAIVSRDLPMPAVEYDTGEVMAEIRKLRAEVRKLTSRVEELERNQSELRTDVNKLIRER